MQSIGSTTEMVSGCLDAGQVILQRGTASLGNGLIENWGDSGHADNSTSQQTDTTSTDVDNDEKNQVLSFVLAFSCITAPCFSPETEKVAYFF